MRDERRFTARELTTIHKDWAPYFPEYGTWKKKGRTIKGSYKKRVGSLLMHVWLDDTRKFDYRPHFSVHNLLYPTDSPSAFLDTTLSKWWHLLPRHHEAGKYREAIMELKEKAPLPVEGPLTLSDIIKGYLESWDKLYHVKEVETPALIAGWCGRIEVADELIEEFAPWYEEYYKDILDLGRVEDEPIPEEWKKEMRGRVRDREGLERILAEELQKHELEDLPYYDLIIDV